jgi:hypothetical protein
LHALWEGNHWHNSGGAGNHTFLTTPATYSLAGQSSLMRIVGWDRWSLKWEHPAKNQTDGIFISAGDNTTPNFSPPFSEQNGDLSLPAAGTQTFYLRDHHSTGDAIRLKIPHINWLSGGDVKNQYIWVENRQIHSPFDQDADACTAVHSIPGIYMYYQVGKDKLTAPPWRTILKYTLRTQFLRKLSEKHPGGGKF